MAFRRVVIEQALNEHVPVIEVPDPGRGSFLEARAQTPVESSTLSDLFGDHQLKVVTAGPNYLAPERILQSMFPNGLDDDL